MLGKQVSKTLAEKEKINVRPKQAKVVLNMRNGITKQEYRNSFKVVDYFENYFSEEDNAKMAVRWREGLELSACPETVTNTSMSMESVPLE